MHRQLLCWLRTARHLPASQIVAWARARGLPGRRVVIAETEPALRASSWADLARAASALESHTDRTDLATAYRLLDHRFRFLNEERRLQTIDWSARYVSALWTYHLHYFDYAVDLAVAWRATADPRFLARYVGLWSDWLDAVTRAPARLAPYPTSVRCLNALRSLWLVHDQVPEPFVGRLLTATYAQLDWLADHLERHLRANHLHKNLTALSWGSLAFVGPEASRWERHRDESWSELREQVLSDGVHFERSPMYHAAVLDDALRTFALCRAAGVDVPSDVHERLAAMTRALQWISRPDGSFHLFNDAVNGERPRRNDVVELARTVLGEPFPEPVGTFALPDAGYFGGVDPGGRYRCIVDAGPLGPRYQPGHAHCDMLSFEFDLAGRSLVVDAGVHGYDRDPYREYVRSTRAHNTVSIDGRDQHEMWATFRVARRGEILRANVREIPDGFEFEGACRPYHDRRSVHWRVIRLSGHELIVTDRVEGASGRPVSSWLHVHPEFRVDETESGFVASAGTHPRLEVRLESFGADEILLIRGQSEPVQGWHCPEFGLARDAATLELGLAANDGREFGWRIRIIR